MKLQNSQNLNSTFIDHDPTGTCEKIFKEAAAASGQRYEDVLNQLPSFLSEPLLNRKNADQNGIQVMKPGKRMKKLKRRNF